MAQESGLIPRWIGVSVLFILVCAMPEARALMSWEDYGRHEVDFRPSIFVAMEDGVALSTDFYFPRGATHPLPAVLIRTPYGKREDYVVEPLKFFASHGYVGIAQDIRGKNESEGEFFAYQDEGPDGSATLDWIVSQSWSNGSVGTYGCSYLGEVQDMLARERHPAHKAAVVQGSSAYQGKHTSIRILGFSQNGVPELAAALGWNRESGGQRVSYGPPPHIDREQWFQSDASRYYAMRPTLPEIDTLAVLRTLPSVEIAKRAGSPWSFYEQWISKAPYDPWFDRIAGFDDEDRFAVPALHMSSWYDYNFSPRMGFALYSNNATTPVGRDNQFLILDPGAHCQFTEGKASADAVVGERHIGDVRYNFVQLYLDWFNYWLKGVENDVTQRSKVQYYLMGEGGGWRSAADWPPRGTRPVTYFVTGGGNANSISGDGKLVRSRDFNAGFDSFEYDPRDPVPSRGGLSCCTGSLKDEGGAVDQRPIQVRNDLLVYASQPLEDPLTVTGSVIVELYVSSDAPDTDFTVKLSDVDEHGHVWILSDGIMRMRYRDGLAEKAPALESEKVYKIRLELQATGIRFGVGHRIQLEIASSGFPRWERNLNTGGDNYNETKPRMATNTVFYSDARPSRIILPVLDPGTHASYPVQ